MEKKNFILALVVILLVGGVFGFILGKNNKVDNTPEDKVVIIDGENIELFDSTHREDGGENGARLIDCNSSSDYEKERKLMNRINTDNSTSQQT